jgi:hypothetical protein
MLVLRMVLRLVLRLALQLALGTHCTRCTQGLSSHI